jgi:hypothetical protein
MSISVGTEFGGDEGLLQPGSKGAARKPKEVLGLMHRTDENDETSGVDVVSERAV